MKIGDKVLCVNDKKWIYPQRNHPKAGEVYTIRDIDTQNHSILLNEIINDKQNFREGYLEPDFYLWRFIKWNPEEEMIELLKEVKTKII